MKVNHCYNIAAAIAVAAWISVSCAEEKLEPAGGEEAVAENAVAGELVIRVSDAVSEVFEAATVGDGTVDIDRIGSWADEVSGIEILSMERLFPHGGKFEARRRESGLHLWYIITYDEAVGTKAAAESVDIPGVDVIEIPQRLVPLYDPDDIIEYVEPDPWAMKKASQTALTVFDDPMLVNQWHYYNDGSTNSSVSGCDINVVPVWEHYTAGSEDVIVAIIDGGVDWSHEDLAANMWTNPAQSGNRIYGYNFVTDGYLVTADSHGTHVAGTVAAVNNNGIGVCGIAGGDAKKGIGGVKIMSCQIFAGEEDASTSLTSRSLTWAADHGAVIAQNSWGYTKGKTPQSLRDAIQYFVDNAGLDENGVQTGPMDGGLVLFSAGNGGGAVEAPAYEENVVCVTSVGADYRKAYYSAYGPEADIAAPGGDARKGNYILSTLPGNEYGRMQGTSMACPHASGVAALLLSWYGGQGYTAEALKERLLNYVTDISGYNLQFNLGSGLVNAYLAMAGSGGVAPQTPSGLTASASSNNVEISVSVPADEDENDGTPYSIIVYYDTVPEVSKDSPFGLFYVGSLKTGETLTGTIGGLDFNTPYYFAAAARDLAANESELSSVATVTTGENHAPVITSPDENSMNVHFHQTKSFRYELKDPDGHFYNLFFTPGSDAAVLDTTDRAAPRIVISGNAAPAGTYTATMDVVDVYNASASVSAEYTILENSAPYTVAQFEDMVFTSRTNGTLIWPASDYFADDDGEALTYTIVMDNPSVVNVNYTAGNFYVTTMKYGYCNISITGTDASGDSVTQSFNVLVKDGASQVEVYPNPVVDSLFIRTGEDYDITYGIYASNGSCVMSGSAPVSPFSPISLDVRGLAAGVYKMEISVSGAGSESASYSRTFVKL